MKSRAVRTDPGSAPSARVAIRGRHERVKAGSAAGSHLPLARPAISAAGISQRQPALPAGHERLGLPLAYISSVDLDLDPHVLDGARAVVSEAHDEYW